MRRYLRSFVSVVIAIASAAPAVLFAVGPTDLAILLASWGPFP